MNKEITDKLHDVLVANLDLIETLKNYVTSDHAKGFSTQYLTLVLFQNLAIF